MSRRCPRPRPIFETSGLDPDGVIGMLGVARLHLGDLLHGALRSDECIASGSRARCLVALLSQPWKGPRTGWARPANQSVRSSTGRQSTLSSPLRAIALLATTSAHIDGLTREGSFGTRGERPQRQQSPSADQCGSTMRLNTRWAISARRNIDLAKIAGGVFSQPPRPDTART